MVQLLLLALCQICIAASAVDQLLLTRSANRGLALTWVTFPPSSISPSSYKVYYGPSSSTFSLSTFPTATFAYPSSAPSPWNGTVFYAPLPDVLLDQEYSYQIRDAATGLPLSRAPKVRSPPDISDDVTLIALANMGVSSEAGIVQAAVIKEVTDEWDSDAPIAAILMPGDLAFANSSSDILDAWAEQCSPLAATVPILTALGHAELQGDASAAAYRTRLGSSMPDVSSDHPFAYSDDLGLVHVVSFATDGDFSSPHSLQWAWLEADLKQAAEARKAGSTHFVVAMAHTPLFSSNTAAPSNVSALRALLLPLFNSYSVDVALWSHVAAYERTYPISVNASSSTSLGDSLLVINSTNGTVHLSLGSGGRPIDSTWIDQPPQWSAVRIAEQGYVMLRAFHNHSMRIQFIYANFTVADESWIIRANPGANAGPVLIVASLASMVIIGVAIVIVFFLMRRLGDVPARTYDELKQEEKSTAL